jgi:hypothetical protein
LPRDCGEGRDDARAVCRASQGADRARGQGAGGLLIVGHERHNREVERRFREPGQRVFPLPADVPNDCIYLKRMRNYGQIFLWRRATRNNHRVFG